MNVLMDGDTRPAIAATQRGREYLASPDRDGTPAASFATDLYRRGNANEQVPASLTRKLGPSERGRGWWISDQD
jgi:hypothetical protein